MNFGEGKFLKTRTEHRCAWCGEPIPSKTKVYHYKGMYEDEWQDWYMHEECHGVYSKSDDDEFSPHENERPKLVPEKPNSL